MLLGLGSGLGLVELKYVCVCVCVSGLGLVKFRVRVRVRVMILGANVRPPQAAIRGVRIVVKRVTPSLPERVRERQLGLASGLLG